MGLLRRRRPSTNRIAEGGCGSGSTEAPMATSPSPIKSLAPTAAASASTNELDLFGADSEASDDEATIARYASEHELNEEDEGKTVSALTSKLSPEELFIKYDTDGSGAISVNEFIAMLPDLGLRLSRAKAIRIFRKCDTDGGGEIDLTEFKMAMFAVDPVSGNTLGFSPSTLLGPRDVFELFDVDGTGQIDELEFADVLEYFGLAVSDEKQEALFKKYDKDKSGYIDFREFRAMWMKLVNVREELTKRNVEMPKYATPWRLQQLLETTLNEEDAREATVLAEAEKFRQKQREKQQREVLGRKAIVRAQDELAAALDAAGQVYILGSGKYQQFAGKAVVRDEDLFPGFKDVSAIWADRVDPKPRKPPPAPAKAQVNAKDGKSDKKQPQIPKVDVESNGSTQQKQVPAAVSKYVRRRPENRRWKFTSAPKLNVRTVYTLKRHRLYGERDVNGSIEDDAEGAESRTESSEVETIPEKSSEDDTDELARLFYEDREFVRSLRFQATRLMANTGSLWGRSVVQGALSDNVAYVVTSSGSVFTWGGKDNTWEAAVVTRADTIDYGDDSDEEQPAKTIPIDEPADEEALLPASESNNEAPSVKLTARSALQKMATPEQLRGIKDPEIEAREDERLEAGARQQEQDERYESFKRVVLYYNVWEPPPSNATRLLFMEQILLPQLEYDVMLQSAQWRGLDVERIARMDLVLMLAECFALEVEVRGESGHAELQSLDTRIRTYTLEKNVKLLQPEKDKLLGQWKELKTLREERIVLNQNELVKKAMAKIRRADEAFTAMIARRQVQLEDLTPEFTTRGANFRVEMSGTTTRGPAFHSPRGAVAVANVAAGNAHAALLTHNGSVYTWGIGCNGRLGHQQNDRGALCYDVNHPQRVEALRDVNIRQIACAYSHSAAISSDGALFVWGSASCGKLGTGVVDDIYEQHSALPLIVKFPGRRAVRSVSCGAAHTGAVSTAGELFVWGCANGGRLGLGAQVIDTVVVPTLVRSLVSQKIRVWQVSCGSAHSALCTEVQSELHSGSKKLVGGQVFVCGGATALGRSTWSWEHVPELDGVGIRQVACGTSHTSAVSAYGELYTWGRNQNGCTGHNVERLFVAKPELLRTLHVEPYNVALGKKCRQMSIYNEQGPELAVNGDIEGTLAKCIHTHLEDKPWWEVDLGQPTVIERIRIWNRTDVPLNPSKPRTEYTGRLFPFWVMVSEFPFQTLTGKEGLRAAKVQSSTFEQFHTDKRMTEWVLPTANTIGQYVRVQLQSKHFLHLAEVEVFGVYSAFKYVGRVGSVHCSSDATLVVIPPVPLRSTLDDYYLRAVQADADNATILRQYEAYGPSYDRFYRGGREHDAMVERSVCRLCRVFRDCEICEFYSQTTLRRTAEEQGHAPKRVVGDRLGLKELVAMAVDDGSLEAEAQQRDREAAELAERQRQEAEAQAAAEAAAALAAQARQPKLSGLLQTLTKSTGTMPNLMKRGKVPRLQHRREERERMLLGATRSKPRAVQTQPASRVASADEAMAPAKKQRSIHDFFQQTSQKKRTNIEKTPPPKNAVEQEDEVVTKRIDYDSSDMEDSPGLVPSSQNSDVEPTRTPSAAVTPNPTKRIDFRMLSSQQSSEEPDGEPSTPSVVVPGGRYATSRVNGRPPSGFSQSSFVDYHPDSLGAAPSTPCFGRMYSQDDMDFLTPLDQPVMHLSHPTTPSPLKKRARRSDSIELIREEVQNLTQDMTHMDVCPQLDTPMAEPFESPLGLPPTTPGKTLDLSAIHQHAGKRRSRDSAKEESVAAPLSAIVDDFVNPFAPTPPTDARRKKRSQRKRQSFPATLVSTGSPYSKYLTEFAELELLGSGAFSKVYKCMKKIDGWTYAVKKSRRHFRGKADTERALREVQALAALSSSRHVIRYFDAWIENELLYIQLEHCSGCSVAAFVEKHKPLHIPEATLCKILAHIAQALADMHSKKMVHMDVKLQNVLVAPGEIYKLGDLGTVAHMDGSMEITEGDNRYLSRELLEGSRTNLRAGDIFALGATIYELALGRTLPTGGEEWQQIRDGDLVMFRQYSNSLQHLIASLMHPDPLQRPLAQEILQHEVVLPFR